MKQLIFALTVTVLCSLTTYSQTTTSFDANDLSYSQDSLLTIGVNAGALGHGSTFVGIGAGEDAGPNVRNTFIGALSGADITGSGNDNNVGIGYQSLDGISDNSNNNLSIGYRAGKGLVNSSNSVVMGASSGLNADRLNYTVSIGRNSSNNNINTRDAVIIGASAGANSSMLSSTVCIGEEAGRWTDGSYSSVLIGRRAGALSQGGYRNIFIGSQSGQESQNARGNICIGDETCQNLSSIEGETGGSNIFIGTRAGEETNGRGNIFLGARAGQELINADYTLIIESSDDTVNPLIYGDFAENKVGINTSSLINSLPGNIDLQDYALYVGGGILSDEVRVRTNWADYVFDSSYELRSLDKVKQFINEHHHLPNMPSEEDVLAQGIEIGDMTRLQQEKIEELTLYIIQQDEKINELETLLHSVIDKLDKD